MIPKSFFPFSKQKAMTVFGSAIRTCKKGRIENKPKTPFNSDLHWKVSILPANVGCTIREVNCVEFILLTKSLSCYHTLLSMLHRCCPILTSDGQGGIFVAARLFLWNWQREEERSKMKAKNLLSPNAKI